MGHFKVQWDYQFPIGKFKIQWEYENFPLEIIKSDKILIFPWENKSPMGNEKSHEKLSYSHLI